MMFFQGYLFPFSLVCILGFLLLPSLADPVSFAYSLFIWNSMNMHSRISVHADMLPASHVLGTVKIHFPCLLVPNFILKSIFLALLKCITLTIINTVKLIVLSAQSEMLPDDRAQRTFYKAIFSWCTDIFPLMKVWE